MGFAQHRLGGLPASKRDGGGGDARFHDASRAARLSAAALATATFDVGRLEAEAGRGGTTLTELADTLVREQDLSFPKAHGVVRRVASAMEANASCDLGAVLAEASREVIGRPLDYPAGRLSEILGPRHFVQVRKTPGGPSKPVVEAAIAASRDALAADTRWLDDRRRALASAAERLQERSRAL